MNNNKNSELHTINEWENNSNPTLATVIFPPPFKLISCTKYIDNKRKIDSAIRIFKKEKKKIE